MVKYNSYNIANQMEDEGRVTHKLQNLLVTEEILRMLITQRMQRISIKIHKSKNYDSYR